MIPEIPIIGSLDFKVKCIVCQKPIAGWVVAESNLFSCPSCNQKLRSNFKAARKKAIIVSIVLYAVALIAFFITPQESYAHVVLYVLGGILPLLLGFIVFRNLFKINKIN